MATLIIETANDEEIKLLTPLLKALKISFKKVTDAHAKKIDSPYNQEFVEKILESKRQFERGEYEIISVEDLWK